MTSEQQIQAADLRPGHPPPGSPLPEDDDMLEGDIWLHIA